MEILLPSPPRFYPVQLPMDELLALYSKRAVSTALFMNELFRRWQCLGHAVYKYLLRVDPEILETAGFRSLFDVPLVVLRNIETWWEHVVMDEADEWRTFHPGQFGSFSAWLEESGFTGFDTSNDSDTWSDGESEEEEEEEPNQVFTQQSIDEFIQYLASCFPDEYSPEPAKVEELEEPRDSLYCHECICDMLESPSPIASPIVQEQEATELFERFYGKLKNNMIVIL